jgi:hypothetical protein
VGAQGVAVDCWNCRRGHHRRLRLVSFRWPCGAYVVDRLAPRGGLEDLHHPSDPLGQWVGAEAGRTAILTGGERKPTSKEDRLWRRPAWTHSNSMIRLHEARCLRSPSSILGPLFVRRRRAGRPQRSEDRTGPATSGGGRRPLLTRVRKLLTVPLLSRRVHAAGSEASGVVRVGQPGLAQSGDIRLGAGPSPGSVRSVR